MHIVFSDMPLPTEQTKSIFLEGPSPRSQEVGDWRQEFVATLEAMGFDGTLYIPIPRNRFYPTGTFDNDPSWTYDGQVAWEQGARSMSDVLLCWVDRRIDRSRKDLGMPGFTTNVEFGEDLHTGKLVYGRPDGADKISYLDECVRGAGLAVHTTIRSACDEALERLGAGAKRVGAETQVPLFIWNTASFQSWYGHLLQAGNRLDGAKVLSQVCFGSAVHPFVFSYCIKVNIWVASEQRHKSNEIIVARPDISAVVALYRTPEGSTKIVLVREFRSPVNNAQGMVYELPAGSCLNDGLSPDENAQQELHEETGLLISDASRFRQIGCRQLAATFSTHRAHVVGVELNTHEFERLVASQGVAFGEPAATSSGERTYVELASLDEVFALPVDYSTLGMIYEALRFFGHLKQQ